MRHSIIVLLVASIPVFPGALHAAITDGQNADDALGHFEDATATTLVPVYTNAAANNGPNRLGMRTPGGIALDSVHHRLFVSDRQLVRVVVYNLNTDNTLADAIPDYVLGQSNWHAREIVTTRSGMSSPWNIAYDPVGDRLFVAEFANNRVLVFDTASITNGEDATNVLGQTDFTSSVRATTQSGLNNPYGLAFDAVANRLFVAEYGNNRVLVFDTTTITDGENAVSILGQANFTSSGAATTQAGMSGVIGVAFDATNNRLFAADYTNNRILVFDTTSVTDGENAVSVLGQSTFTGSTAATTQTGMSGPYGASYDATNGRLFVAEYGNHRVTVFDVASISNGENAANVLGQAAFNTATSAATAAGMNRPVATAYDTANNRLYVAHYSQARVTVYNTAVISDGENAVDALGQYEDPRAATLTAIFTKSTYDDGPNRLGFSAPGEVEIDTVHHRLFAADQSNNRVLVYNLNTDNTLADAIPDNVLGQSNFYSNAAAATQSGMYNPWGIAYDATNERLFVAQWGQHRVTVYDVASITDGENAVNVLGQSTFTGSTAATTQAGMNRPISLSYDADRSYLYVTDATNNRVLVYDVASITNGENAINVLGQALFTTSAAAATQAGMSSPQGAAYDAAGKRLFVSNYSYSRVLVFDVTTIEDGENAVNVLGQANFTATAAATTQAGMNIPRDLAYDSSRSRLFVAQRNGNRVTVYDVASITDGENAVSVLGQATYTSATAATTQAGMSYPLGVAYDTTQNRLFVSELSNSRVTYFDLSTATSIVLTSSPNPSLESQSVTLTATVTPSATGSVVFQDSSRGLGTVTLSGGVATLLVPASWLSSGMHSLTATYARTGDFKASTSSPLLHEVVSSSIPSPTGGGGFGSRSPRQSIDPTIRRKIDPITRLTTQPSPIIPTFTKPATSPPASSNLPPHLENMRERMVKRIEMASKKQPQRKAVLEKVLKRFDARITRRK